MEERELTFGEKACGVPFNPDGNDLVAEIKAHFAAVVDNLNLLRGVTTSDEVKRMLSIAITDVQTAQMWAVKAITWQY